LRIHYAFEFWEKLVTWAQIFNLLGFFEEKFQSHTSSPPKIFGIHTKKSQNFLPPQKISGYSSGWSIIKICQKIL
jgi:hypothetical protein